MININETQLTTRGIQVAGQRSNFLSGPQMQTARIKPNRRMATRVVIASVWLYRNGPVVGDNYESGLCMRSMWKAPEITAT